MTSRSHVEHSVLKMAVVGVKLNFSCCLSSAGTGSYQCPIYFKMASVLAITSNVINMAKTINEMLGDMKHNKDKCRIVSERVQTLSGVVAQINSKPDPVFEQPLRHVEDVILKVKQFIEGHRDMGRVKQFLRARALKEDFMELERDLNAATAGTVF